MNDAAAASRMAATAGIVASGDDLIPRLGNDFFILLLHLRHTGAVRIMKFVCIGIQNIGLFCRRIRCRSLAGIRNNPVLLSGLVLLVGLVLLSGPAWSRVLISAFLSV